MSERQPTKFESIARGVLYGAVGGLVVGEFINFVNTAPRLTGRVTLDAIIGGAAGFAGGALGLANHELAQEQALIASPSLGVETAEE